MKQRKNIIIFIITMILSVIVLWFFVTGYDSIDTYRIYSQGYIDYATKDAYINIIIAIAILSLCVIQIYHLIERYKKLEKARSKIIAFMFSYTYIFNYLIVDVLKFIDSFMIATSILLFIIAIKKNSYRKKEYSRFGINDIRGYMLSRNNTCIYCDSNICNITRE